MFKSNTRLRRRLIYAAWIGLALTGLLKLSAGADAQESDVWRIGVAQTPDAPTPGAKPRTPVRIETLAFQDGTPLQALSLDQALAQLQQDQLDVWVGVVPQNAVLPNGVQRRDLDWSVGPMAIMRTDTDIHDWASLAGRTVCLSADGRFTGELSARFGAVEQLYPSATDALLALRIGQCDAAVQDERFLRQLSSYPEWRKFSAQLKPYRRAELTQLQRADRPMPSGRHALQQALSPARLQQVVQEQAKAIAFEVYLDQTVPDCH